MGTVGTRHPEVDTSKDWVVRTGMGMGKGLVGPVVVVEDMGSHMDKGFVGLVEEE